MKITVLIEPLNGKGFRATGSEPFSIRVEGSTREEAIKNFTTEAEARLKAGAELITLDIGPTEHPWLKFAGMFKDDPMFDEWKQAIEEYRDQVDKEDEMP
jgi:hypothetical protein